MIVYDVTNMESFLNVRSWIDLLYEHFDIAAHNKLDPEEAFILVGNKSDMNMSRQVKKERGMELA
jgi:GTPase SAR1 family protein